MNREILTSLTNAYKDWQQSMREDDPLSIQTMHEKNFRSKLFTFHKELIDALSDAQEVSNAKAALDNQKDEELGRGSFLPTCQDTKRPFTHMIENPAVKDKPVYKPTQDNPSRVELAATVAAGFAAGLVDRSMSAPNKESVNKAIAQRALGVADALLKLSQKEP